MVDYFYAIYEGKVSNLEKAIETFKEIGNARMPDNIFPIAYDSGGNKICISVSGKDFGFIYFWDHEEEVDEGEIPNYNNLYLLAKNLNEFLESLTEE